MPQEVIMRLSTKSRYGTRAMLDIALQSSSGKCAQLKDIAERQTISPKYLDHILSALRKAGLIKNIRGKNGGYTLMRHPAAITLKDIVDAVEGSIAPVECIDNPSLCDRTPTCSTRDVWTQLKKTMDTFLESTTLTMLIENQNTKNRLPLNYSI